MAEAIIKTSDEILDCPICLEQYRTPRSLPCLHSFCEECLNSYITSHTDNSTDFPCPLCRSTVILPSPKSSTGSPAQNFPLNHLIVTMMDGGMGRNEDITCTPCNVRDDSSQRAIYWCNDCCEGLCEKCYTYHRKNKFFSKHRPILIGESPNATIRVNVDIVDEDCPRHRGKILEVYCSDHSELCCVVCFATKHRECKQIHSVDDISEGFDVDNVCLKSIKEMRELEEGVPSLASAKDNNIGTLDEEVKVTTAAITEEINRAKERLDSVSDTLISDVKQRYETEKQKLQRQQKRIQAFQMEVNNCSKVMTSISNTGTRRQVFVTFQKMKSQLVSHYQQLKSELANDVDTYLKFNSGPILTTLVTTSSVGEVETVKIPSRKTSDIITQMDSHLDKLVHYLSPAYSMDLMKANVRLVKVVTRDDIGLGKVDLASGTFLQDGRLLIADYSDERLILFDEKFKVADILPVAGKPTCIALGVKLPDILVCIDQQETILQYSMRTGSELVKENELSVPHRVWSVTAFDKVLIIGGNNCVSRISLGDNEIDTSDIDGDCTDDANQTYVFNDGKSIVCKRLEGKEVFKHDTGRSVAGTAVDQDGNVYVGYLSDIEEEIWGVYQISRDGKQSRILVEALNRITNPYTVIFHRTKPLFVVVSDDEDTVLEVYEFVT